MANGISETKPQIKNPYSDLDLRYKSYMGFNLICICIYFYKDKFLHGKYVYIQHQLMGVNTFRALTAKRVGVGG